MELQTLTYIVVGFTFAIYIGIAIWARAGSTKEFYVAGGGHCQRYGHRGGLDECCVVYFDGWTDRLYRVRWFGLPDGVDRWLSIAGDVFGAVLAQIRQVYSAGIYR